VIVAVIDHCPVYRYGLIRALEDAGYRVDPAAGWGEDASTLTVAVVRSDEDRDRLASAKADLVVVAVLENASPERYAEALAAGASTAVAEDAPVTAVVEACKSVASGVRKTANA
jgi:DNA-binding NarL/FixJ family response regulator